MLSRDNIAAIERFLRAKQADKSGIEYETEAKFAFSDNSHYSRLLLFLRSENAPVSQERIEVSEVRTYPDRVRKVCFSRCDNPETTVWQKKEQYQSDIRLTEYDIKIGLNKEIPLSRGINGKETSIRNRTRIIFVMRDYPIEVHMTEIMTVENNKSVRTFEVEVEFNGDIKQIDSFEYFLNLIFKQLRGSNNVYSNVMKIALNGDVAVLLGDRDGLIRSSNLVQTRNIKLSDIVNGGIVNNKQIKPKFVDKSTEIGNILRVKRNFKNTILATGANPGGTQYAMTYKADGLRKMLITHKTGVWLVYPPHEFNLVLTDKEAEKIIETYKISVFDGEMINNITANGLKYWNNQVPLYWYLVFDCLVYQNVNVEFYQYKSRKSFTDFISKAIKNSTLTVETKPVVYLTFDNFFDEVKRFLDERNKLPWKEDGLIFTPTDIIYNPHSDIYEMKSRHLTQLPDVCKWKEPKDITIDFAVSWKMIDGQKQLRLLSYQEEKDEEGKRKGVNVEFTGSNFHPYPIESLKATSNYILNTDDDINNFIRNSDERLVVEFEWNGLMFKPRLIRKDKQSPNRLAVAQANWNDVIEPITAEDLSGETIKLTRRYHNRIKEDLYKKLDKNINLLDIGSGKGGDLNKWSKHDGKIIAVEPNPINYTEFKERVQKYDEINDKKIGDRITLLQDTGGEETVKITAAVKKAMGKANVISLMLSLSFFWSSDVHLEALVRTIVSNLKPGGKIIFFTIDGDIVEQEIFNNIVEGHRKIVSADLYIYPPFEMYGNDRSPITNQNAAVFGRPLDFKLPDTIVGDQEEYIVHLDDLTNKLKSYGFVLKETKIADGRDELLSNENRIYSSMYVSGFYQHNGTAKLTEFKEDLSLPTLPERIKKINEKTKCSGNKKKEEELPSLTVLVTGTGPAQNDDSFEVLKCSWYQNLVRIATIGDGNCFIHAVLKAFYTPYQENNNAEARIDMTKKVRRDLAVMLLEENPNYSGYTYWETIGNGRIVQLLLQEIKDQNLIAELGVDYSPIGLQNLLNSISYLGDEIFEYVADILNINIYVMKATKEDIRPCMKCYRSGRASIVISGNKDHYEVIALQVGNYLQTIFYSDDDFFQVLDKKFPVIDQNKFDPDDTFITDFIDTFTTNKQFVFPVDIFDIFPDPNDVFARKLDRNLDAIEERINL